MIPKELADCFSHGARERGERYLAEGRIELLAEEPLLIRTIAHGSEPWLVELDASGPRAKLRMSCACPFAQDNGFCKHLWATLRLVDQRRQLAPLIEASHGGIVEVSGSEESLWGGAEPLPSAQRASRPNRAADKKRPKAPPSPPPEWQRVMQNITALSRYEAPAPAPAVWPADRRLVYIADLVASASQTDGLVIELATEKRGRDGEWELPKLFRSGIATWRVVPDLIDREIGQMLRGSRRANEWVQSETMSGFVVAPNAFDTVLRLMSETGRLRIRREQHERPVEPAQWDSGPPWQVRYRVRRGEVAGSLVLFADLERDGETMPLEKTSLLHNVGFVVYGQSIARAEINGPYALLVELSKNGPITLEERELPSIIGALSQLPRAPRLQLPEGLGVREVSPSPTPVLAISRSPDGWRRDHLFATLSFDYGGLVVSDSRSGAMIFDSRHNQIIHRDPSLEAAAGQMLKSLGVRYEQDWRQGPLYTFGTTHLEALLRELSAAHWRVLVEGVSHRASTAVRANVSSGVDWFDLDVQVTFGDTPVPLPRVLAALREKQSVIQLDDGVGLITADLRKRLTPLLAATSGAHGLRFGRSQTALLDALLATLPAAQVDEQFDRARTELRTFDRVEPHDSPSSFQGTLRPYQREGLGWFHFLRRFGLGGCLADDMGLGKTVQVLALLEARRVEGAGPSLVVVPRSLVFNWEQEAARFTPALRVLDHTGVGRDREISELRDQNLIITTYGTLRQDITVLREVEFDYVILDEAQAIKNATTASAKAARLLRARHRLALTGTPIENRVDELWSLFEFLNPGMLGSSSAFKALARVRLESPAGAAPDEKTELPLLARALRPVILRRTKERVAPELPPKVEQTLMVELEPAQRRVYDELLVHYRQSLLPYVERVGIARSKLQVLEALLRLRQAACHPALIAKTHDEAPSAKLDVLLPKLEEANSEGHKSLVFSQFTTFLALLRERLDAKKIGYAYLDGATRNRQTIVEAFQQDPACRLFLISLRAGGHGLNLTAADYVFLLDPWWNPAVEAQAIDRAHRIGQHQHVIATRLVARDTIEEKILELQRSKRDLADAILSEDQGTLARIGREELELLLS